MQPCLPVSAPFVENAIVKITMVIKAESLGKHRKTSVKRPSRFLAQIDFWHGLLREAGVGPVQVGVGVHNPSPRGPSAPSPRTQALSSDRAARACDRPARNAHAENDRGRGATSVAADGS